MHEVITDNLDLWASTLLAKSSAGRGSNGRLEAYGIKKLRELILELAVRGKLVPQDPNDEPAKVFLDRIGQDKARLPTEGKVGRTQPLPEITVEETPFVIHASWEWVRLGALGQVFNGNSISERVKETKYTGIEGGLPFVATKDVGYGWQELDYENGVSIPPGEQGFKVAHQGAVLICCEGGSAGKKCGITDRDICFGNKLYALEPYAGVSSRFLLANYLTPTFFSQFTAKMTGIIGGISLANFNQLLVPLPPVNEQRRIVAKIDELMALCDQLERQQTDSLEAHQTLVETLLGTLTCVATPQELTEAWTRIAGHFDILLTTDDSIDQLKQTILQLAVMGKLVPQDTNDEPANELLEKIATENAKLVQEKKIKRYPPVEPFGDEYELPNSWEAIVVQDFADVRLGSTPSRAEPKYWGGDIPWVSSGEVANCVIRDTNEKITQDGFNNASVSLIPKRSVLIAIIGQGKTRGQSAILNIDACTNQNVAALVFNESLVVPEFVWIWARSKYESHRGEGRGGAQPALNGKQVRSFRFYLPPTAEQHRIVAKVDELMGLCDALKARLADAQTTQIHLADAIVEQAVA